MTIEKICPKCCVPMTLEDFLVGWYTCPGGCGYELLFGGPMPAPKTKDEVGGVHEDGMGWNPQGVWCGECGNLSCKGCPHEFDVDGISSGISHKVEELQTRHRELLQLVTDLREDFKATCRHRRLHKGGMEDHHTKHQTRKAHIAALKFILKRKLREIREIKKLAADVYDDLMTEFMYCDADEDQRRDAQQSYEEAMAEIKAEREAEQSMGGNPFYHPEEDDSHMFEGCDGYCDSTMCVYEEDPEMPDCSECPRWVKESPKE